MHMSPLRCQVTSSQLTTVHWNSESIAMQNFCGALMLRGGRLMFSSSPEEAQQPDGQVQPQRRVRATFLLPAWHTRAAAAETSCHRLHAAYSCTGPPQHVIAVNRKCGVSACGEPSLQCCVSFTHTTALGRSTQSPTRPIALSAFRYRHNRSYA